MHVSLFSTTFWIASIGVSIIGVHTYYLFYDTTTARVVENGDDFYPFIEPSYFYVTIHNELSMRVALNDPNVIWPGGVVPYIVSRRYDRTGRRIIRNAMNEFNNKTCVRFVPRIDESSYISIAPGQGCFATVGRVISGVGRVSINRGCYTTGTAIHELMHALGFVHEQSRPDRDDFITVNFSNIDRRQQDNFKKFTWRRVQNLSVGYDYGSVMHYGAFDFAVDRRIPTIVPKRRGAQIGQRVRFSPLDLLKINRLYNCTGFL